MTGLVKNLMSHFVTTITESMPFTHACRLFTNLHFHHLPVKDDQGQLIGMFSTTDAIYALNNKLLHYPIHSEEDINQLIKVEDIMTSDNLFTLKPNDNIERAIELFQKQNIHSIPILDDDERIVGILTSNDILASFRRLIKTNDKN